MREKHESTSVRFTPTTRAKLIQLANELGVSRNMVIERLVANAEIQEVVRSEPVAALLVEKNNRHDVKVSAASNVTAVGW